MGRRQKPPAARTRKESMKKTFYCVCTAYYHDGAIISNIVDAVESEDAPSNSFETTREKDIYCDWFDDHSAALRFVSEARRLSASRGF